MTNTRNKGQDKKNAHARRGQGGGTGELSLLTLNFARGASQASHTKSIRRTDSGGAEALQREDERRSTHGGNKHRSITQAFSHPVFMRWTRAWHIAVGAVALLLFLLYVLWTGAVFPRLVCKSSREESQPSEKPVACLSIQTLAPHSVHIGAPKLPLILWRPVQRRQVRRLVRQQALSAQDRLVQGRDAGLARCLDSLRVAA